MTKWNHPGRAYHGKSERMLSGERERERLNKITFCFWEKIQKGMLLLCKCQYKQDAGFLYFVMILKQEKEELTTTKEKNQNHSFTWI